METIMMIFKYYLVFFRFGSAVVGLKRLRAVMLHTFFGNRVLTPFQEE